MPILLALLLWTPPARATSTCQPDLAKPISLFPWPRVAPEMMDALERLAKEPRWARVDELTEALAQRAAPDRVVAKIFTPASLADVRAHYGPGRPPAPVGHALAHDLLGLRALLARTLAAIPDDHLQLAWMDYMMTDPSHPVRLNVARTTLTWPDQAARDAYVERALTRRPTPDRAVLRAVLSSAALISPEVRWRVIRAYLDRDHGGTDEQVLRALGTFEKKDRGWLRAWYQDQGGVRSLSNLLTAYDPAWRGQLEKTAHGRISKHDVVARGAGITLSELGSVELRRRWTDALTELGRQGTAQGDFAADVVVWSQLSEVVRLYAAELRAGVPRADARRRAEADVAHVAGQEFLRVKFTTAALIEEDAEFAKGEALPPRVDWREGDLEVFEAGLKPANQFVR